MKQRTRIYYSASQRAEIWDRWQRGESMSSIGRQFERESSSFYPLLAPTGSIRPPSRKRSKLSLTLSEREEISRGIVAQQSMRAIARQLGRSPSTICREINRNGGYENYRAIQSDDNAWERALRPKRCKLSSNRQLASIVARKLKRQWSPQQIAGWLKRQNPNQELSCVSHETIYKTLYIQARGALKKELQLHLRSRRTIRRAHANSDQREHIQMPSYKRAPATLKKRPAGPTDHWSGKRELQPTGGMTVNPRLRTKSGNHMGHR